MDMEIQQLINQTQRDHAPYVDPYMKKVSMSSTHTCMLPHMLSPITVTRVLRLVALGWSICLPS